MLSSFSCMMCGRGSISSFSTWISSGYIKGLHGRWYLGRDLKEKCDKAKLISIRQRGQQLETPGTEKWPKLIKEWIQVFPLEHSICTPEKKLCWVKMPRANKWSYGKNSIWTDHSNHSRFGTRTLKIHILIKIISQLKRGGRLLDT